MKSETTIKVDLARSSIGTRVEAMQGDGNSRCITVQMLDNGKPWYPPDDTEIAIAYTQPGGTKGFYNKLSDDTQAICVSGSKITIVLAPQMLSVPGKVRAAVVFNNPKLDQLTSFPFTVAVAENPYAGAQQAKDYIRLQWLEERIAELIATEKAVAAGIAADKADTAAANAREQASAARDAAASANTAAALANLAKATAETTAVAASDAAAAANTAAGVAQEKAAAAEKAAVNANDAAQGADTARDAANTAAASANKASAAAQEVVDTVAPDIQKLKAGVSSLGDMKISKFYANSMGQTILNDSDNGRITDTCVFGRSVQDGTPTPETPVEIQSVVNPTVTLSGEAGSKSASLPYTLNAIPVSEGGNVTIDGQQYIADYVDIENMKIVRMVEVRDLGTLRWGAYGSYSTKRFQSEDLNISTVYNYAMPNILSTHYRADMFDNIYNHRNDKVIGVKDSSIAVYDSAYQSYDTEMFKNSVNGIIAMYPLATPTEIFLTIEDVQEFRDLATYYPVTNVLFTSDQLDGYTTFNYPVSLANGWNYVKQQLGDTRDYIYNMDDRMTDAEYMAAMAYVNSEYAAAITELEV